MQYGDVGWWERPELRKMDWRERKVWITLRIQQLLPKDKVCASVNVLEASVLILCKAGPTCPKCRHIFLHKALILKQLKVKGFLLKGFN